MSGSALASIVAAEFVALGSLAAPLVLGLAVAVKRLDTAWTPEQTLSLVTALGALSAMIANPIFGALSDRTRHRGSGRPAWVLGGVLAGVPAVWSLTQMSTVAGLVVAWCFAQAAFNATFAGLYGLIADQVPEEDRARVSGWFGGAAVGSVVAALGVAAVMPKDLGPIMLPMPLLAVPTTLVAYWYLRRLPLPSPARRGEGLGAVVAELAANRQYWMVWLQRALVQLTYGIATAYGFYFLIRRAGMGEDRAATWVAVTAAAAASLSAVASVLAGKAVGRSGNYAGPIVASVLVIATGTGVKMVGTSATAYVIASVLVGIGIGCYYAVDLALVLRTVPGRRAGQYLGLFNIARTLPQSLAPAIAPLLLAVGGGDVVGDGSQNYFALYVFGIVIALIALMPMRHITVTRRGETSALGGSRGAGEVD